MIFVTVGTHTGGFDRLVRAADEMAALLDERVVIQRGSSAYRPVHADHFQWVLSHEIDALMREARVIVAQAGAGTVIQAFQASRPLVLMPRLRQFGENHNDHQRQLADALHAQGRAITLLFISGAALCAAVEAAAQLEMLGGSPLALVEALRLRLATWDS
jgi:UDP-N-acetylglucosamine transferase subunit ALG13